MSQTETKYLDVITALAANGARAEFHRPRQLVVSTDAAVLTGRIWITWRDRWFLSTWTPAIYPVPDDVDIVELCLACVAWESGPFYTIPEAITQRFKLVRLDDNATDEVLAAM